MVRRAVYIHINKRRVGMEMSLGPLLRASVRKRTDSPSRTCYSLLIPENIKRQPSLRGMNVRSPKFAGIRHAYLMPGVQTACQ